MLFGTPVAGVSSPAFAHMAHHHVEPTLWTGGVNITSAPPWKETLDTDPAFNSTKLPAIPLPGLDIVLDGHRILRTC